MAQCEKILESGERCSNRAAPGAKLCGTHGKILFKRVKEPAKASPPPYPDPKTSKGDSGPVLSDKGPRAAPSPAGREPVFPGLRADERNILVAPQGVVLLESGRETTADEMFNRLVRLMSFLSQAMALAGRVRVMRRGEGGDILVFLSPDEGKETGLSVAYDAAAAAARLADGRLFIGEGNTFIQYRDGRAPRGYDAPEFKSAPGRDELMLVERRGASAPRLGDFTEAPLVDLCLRIAPLPDMAATRPERVYILTPRSFYPILCRYFQKHHLRFGLARMRASKDELILFEISPRPDAPTGQSVPRFTLDYLERLPRAVLLTPAHEEGGPLILLQWRHRHPLRLSRAAELFEPDDMVLLMADHYPNMRVNPAPRFFDGDQLVHAHAPKISGLNLSPKSGTDAPRLNVQVLPRPDNGPTPPIAALILNNRELAWTRTLLYRMPREVFGAYSLCQGEDLSVLLGNEMAIEGIPFGAPLRRLYDAELFIPLRQNLTPDLPWEILRPALEIRDNVYTFFTDDYRIDIPADEFAPLSRSLIADPDRPRIEFHIRPAETPPDLKWTPPPAPRVDADPGQEKPQGVFPRIRGFFSGAKDQSEGVDARPPIQPSGSDEQDRAPLREQAEIFEKEKDFLAAAVCYNILKDAAGSARCYRRAVDPSAAAGPLPPIPETKKVQEGA